MRINVKSADSTDIVREKKNNNSEERYRCCIWSAGGTFIIENVTAICLLNLFVSFFVALFADFDDFSSPFSFSYFAILKLFVVLFFPSLLWICATALRIQMCLHFCVPFKSLVLTLFHHVCYKFMFKHTTHRIACWCHFFRIFSIRRTISEILWINPPILFLWMPLVVDAYFVLSRLIY